MSISIANNNISSSGTLTLNNKPLSDVAFSGSYDDLSDKPSFGNGQLVESWISDDQTQWYRKYGDGYIEQGGKTTVSGLAGLMIQLVTPFADVNYAVQLTTLMNIITDGGADYVFPSNKTTSSFKCVLAGGPAYWYAYGY